MRIVHTSLRYPPSSGGAENYAHDLIEKTKAASSALDVRVITSKLRTHGPMSELDPDLLLDDPIYVQRLHHLSTPLISYPRLQALPYYIQHHAPNIIESYGFWYQPADVTARYALKHKVPFIFHPIYYENKIRHKPLWQIYKNLIGKRTFAAADIVGVISPYEQSLIEKAGFAVKRFELLPPGIDHTLYQKTYDNIFQARGITGTILLSVCRISAGKGLESIINVFPHIIKEHPDAQWVIIGEDFGAKAALKKQAATLGISKHIHWFGKVRDEEKIAAFQHATMFLHPSWYEAFGIVLAEASASRLPIIARDIAAIPYVVPHQKTGLLFKTDQELQTAISTLLKNSALRTTLGEAGKEYIKNNFSWDKTINRLLALYDELRTKN